MWNWSDFDSLFFKKIKTKKDRYVKKTGIKTPVLKTPGAEILLLHTDILQKYMNEALAEKEKSFSISTIPFMKPLPQETILIQNLLQPVPKKQLDVKSVPYQMKGKEKNDGIVVTCMPTLRKTKK